MSPHLLQPNVGAQYQHWTHTEWHTHLITLPNLLLSSQTPQHINPRSFNTDQMPQLDEEYCSATRPASSPPELQLQCFRREQHKAHRIYSYTLPSMFVLFSVIFAKEAPLPSCGIEHFFKQTGQFEHLSASFIRCCPGICYQDFHNEAI